MTVLPAGRQAWHKCGEKRLPSGGKDITGFALLM
jgi:hypothetical protein